MKLFCMGILALALSACATTQQTGTVNPQDPYENINRKVFAFNGGVSKYALIPVAKTYETVTPEFARDRVGDTLSNLSSPVTFANDVLQAKPARASDTLFRFLINTTVGVGGLWDAADYFGLPGHTEDFGQTLGVWGIESGPYLVLPLLGPSNPRDLIGRGADRALDPLNWTEFAGQPDLDDDIAMARAALGGLNGSIVLAEQLEALNQQAEPYIAMRRIYMSQRDAAISDGKIDDESAFDDLPDFDEFVD
ncbi:MAG: MlaA family lipoprotein [Hyphomonas sp.]